MCDGLAVDASDMCQHALGIVALVLVDIVPAAPLASPAVQECNSAARAHLVCSCVSISVSVSMYDE